MSAATLARPVVASTPTRPYEVPTLSPDRTEVVRIPMTFEEYENLKYEGKVEYVNGEAVFDVAARLSHGEAIIEFGVLLRQTFPDLVTGTDVDIFSGLNVRRPDIILVERPANSNVTLKLAPVVVVEITSPSTRSEDWLRKANEYHKINAQQYWLADPEARTLAIFANDGEWWTPVAELDADNPTASIPVGDHGTVEVDLNQLLPVR